MLNIWHPYPLMTPKKDGWYICTAAHGAGLNTPKVMEVYFRKWDKKWYNPRRHSVFDGYKVCEACRAPLEDNRVFTDSECDRIDILAWRPLPRLYPFGRKRG